MKITKTQLKQIIKEETSKVLNEFGQGMSGKYQAIKDIPSVFGGKIIPAGAEFTASLVAAAKVAANVRMENIEQLYQQRDGVYYVTVGPGRATGERYYVFGDDIEKFAGQAQQRVNELGIGRALKGAAGAVKAKAFDKIKGTGNLAQTTQAQKQITAMVQDLAKQGYGGPQGAKLLSQHLQKLAAEIMKNVQGSSVEERF